MAKGEVRVASNEESQSSSAVDLNHFVEDALEDIFNKEEQTYDDLMNGFMFFKKGLTQIYFFFGTVVGQYGRSIGNGVDLTVGS
mgnify:CR=1 FL=1